jgi:hypothetical protein
MWKPRPLATLGASTAHNRDIFTSLPYTSTNRVVENFSMSARVYLNNDLNALQKICGIFVTVPFINYWRAAEKTGKPEEHENKCVD